MPIWGRQEFREIQRKICRGAAGAEIFRNLPPDKLGTVHMAPGLAPGHYRWTQTVPDLNCLAIFGPSPPQPRRAARRARSSGPTLVPSPAAPAPRSLSVLRHAGSAAHDGQASRLTDACRRVRSLTRRSKRLTDALLPCSPLSLTEGEQCLLEALWCLICLLARLSLAHCDRCSLLHSTTTGKTTTTTAT